MPWSNDNGDNKRPNKSPWEGESGRQRSSREDFDWFGVDPKKVKKVFNFTPNDNKFFFYLGLIAFLLWMGTGFYTVKEGEQALILRFGAYTRTDQIGLNYHLPEPIEQAIKERVDQVRREEIGFRSGEGASRGAFMSRATSIPSIKRNVPAESLMLTGDENIVDISFVVQWIIKDIRDYSFNLRNQKETVKSAAESAMREVIGMTPISKSQEERGTIEAEVKDLLQNILDEYTSGIEITAVKLLKTDPPAEVIDSFRDVQTARADREREINQGYSYKNDILPRARGAAAKITQNAEAYRQEVIANATGEASRFDAVLKQYKNAKKVTKKRLYLEAMESVLKDMDKVIIDNNKGAGVLPYLPLPSLDKKK
jgi:modulator of FtsH protease HflK